MIIKLLFFALAAGSLFLSPAAALFVGIVFALIFTSPYPKPSKKISKYLLQVAVVGLGFGINLYQSLEAGRQGVIFTLVTVSGIIVLGYFIGRWLKVSPKMAHLISSGTAICGGSAIAAIAPVVKANENETSVSLAVIFALNAVALFLFPPIGHLLDLTQQQFGLWAAIAIHDTSSVVGAGTAYGPEALIVATTVKLTRALWIIPLALVSMFLFRKSGGSKSIYIPWFILFFVIAMIVNTYVTIPPQVSGIIATASHKMLSLTLFLIGSTLSVKAIKEVGIKPIVLGVSLWIIISIVSLIVITC